MDFYYFYTLYIEPLFMVFFCLEEGLHLVILSQPYLTVKISILNDAALFELKGPEVNRVTPDGDQGPSNLSVLQEAIGTRDQIHVQARNTSSLDL